MEKKCIQKSFEENIKQKVKSNLKKEIFKRYEQQEKERKDFRIQRCYYKAVNENNRGKIKDYQMIDPKYQHSKSGLYEQNESIEDTFVDSIIRV